MEVNVMTYAGKNVLVVGMARSGVGAAQLLVKCGAKVTVNDSKSRSELKTDLSPLDALSVTWAMGKPAMELLEGTDILVLSPGIPDKAAFVKKAKEMGIYVIGEVELGAQLAPGELVAITGTNGKTTTTTLVAEMFKNNGRRSFAVGNIGDSYAGAGVESKPEDVMVCEVSSFQMETADTFHPTAAALLNITEDHLNRHGTMEVYTEMKMRVFAHQTAEDYAIFNADDPALAPLTSQVKSHVLYFSRRQELSEGAFVRDGKMIIRLNGSETEILPVNEIFIPGPHNLENALAAACMAFCRGVPADVIAETLRTFTGVEHRIETVRELEGIRYINDSKGTNVDSTLRAIQTMDRPTVIILGGSDKHCDFTSMVKEMLASPFIKEAVLIGVTADQIERQCLENGYTKIHRCATLKEAIDKSRTLAGEGWNVLLSPACASFDQFSDYEQRGRIFKYLANALR